MKTGKKLALVSKASVASSLVWTAVLAGNKRPWKILFGKPKMSDFQLNYTSVIA